MSCLHKVVYTFISLSILISAVAVLAVSLSYDVKMTKHCDESKEERLIRNKSEDREQILGSHYSVKSMSTREQQLVKQRMAISKNHHIFAFGEVFETSLTSFNISFAILLTLVTHGRPSQKHRPCLQTVMHTCCLSVQRSLRCEQGIHFEYAGP